MPRDEVDDLMEELAKEMRVKKVQDELRQVITQSPANVRKQIEKQELAIEGIKKDEGGNYTQNGRPPNESVLKAALDRVDERMLRESPALQEHKLKFSGGSLVPDEAAYRRDL
jgi:hypothetical protein